MRRAPGASRRRVARGGNGPVQHEHAHVGAGVARGQRLAVGPDAQHRVVCARIELADDRHLHRWTASVRTSSRRTYGRLGEERARLRLGRVAGVAAARRSLRVADRRGVDDPDRPAVLGRDGGPVDVEPPAHRQALGEGQQHVEAVAVEGGHRADLDEGRLARGGARVPARHRPGGMRVQPVRGLGELQAGALGGAQEGVQEAARQRDVVVDDEQPVVGRRRMRGEQRVEVLELAALALRRR